MSERKLTQRPCFAVMVLWVALVAVWPAGTANAAGSCQAPQVASIQDGFRYGLPPQVERAGLLFAHQAIPIHRKDVRDRILKEVNYLLQDRRSRVLLWLAHADSLKPVIGPILRKYAKYELPEDFLYLAAIESSYNSRALSSAGAYGYWQFIRSTAVCGPQGCDDLDWSMKITNWHDERADLVKSTHAAARYLSWLNRVKKISADGQPERAGFNDWLLAAAAYNAGPGRVSERMSLFRAKSYWDTPLPIETERYVPRWIAVGLIGKYRSFYGLRVVPRDTVAFDTVEKVRLAKDLSISDMALLLNTTPRTVWSLNTHIRLDKAVFPARADRRAIEHTIHVPRGTKAKFLAALSAKGYTKK